MTYRLYTFVANLYLSDIQKGIQTAHVVSEMAEQVASQKGEDLGSYQKYFEWARNDKTIIVCGAGTHKGVLDAFAELQRTGTSALRLPSVLFREDEDSMNGMATACGILVPQQYYDAKYVPDTEWVQGALVGRWEYFDEVKGGFYTYPPSHPEGQFIQFLKSFRLA